MNPNTYITVRSYNQKRDEYGEKDLFTGYVWDLLANEKKSGKIEPKKVHAIDQGMVSIIIGVA
jgi:hypothetical protein